MELEPGSLDPHLNRGIAEEAPSASGSLAEAGLTAGSSARDPR